MQLIVLSQMFVRIPLSKHSHQMHPLATQVLLLLSHLYQFHSQHRVSYIHHLEKTGFVQEFTEREHSVLSTNQPHEPERVGELMD